mgnify:CR=1 FL=1
MSDTEHPGSSERNQAHESAAGHEGRPCSCAGKSGEPDNPDRRKFLIRVGIGLNIAAGALVGIPVLGYLFSAFRKKEERSWISLGPADQFEAGKIRLASYRNPGAKGWDGQSADIPCWVRRDDSGEFQVFAINCTHLGCPVRWFEESGLFLCPCHGGAYYQDGARAAGPPPRGLYQYEHRLRNGELLVMGGRIPTLSQSV